MSAVESFENTVGKGGIICNKQFLLFPQCFLPSGELSDIFIVFEIVVCKLFQFGRVLNLSEMSKGSAACMCQHLALGAHFSEKTWSNKRAMMALESLT